MDPQSVSRLLALARIAIGATAFAAPGFVGRRWIGRDGGRDAVSVVIRAVGARDVAIGVGALTASGESARRWVEAGAVADVGDAVATVAARRGLPGRAAAGVIAMAAGAAALGGWLSREMARQEG